MRVKLVNLSSLPITGNRPVYPLGLASVADALKREGHGVDLIDFVEHPRRATDLSWAYDGNDVIGFAIRDVDPIDIAAPSFVPTFVEFARRVRAVAGERVMYVGGGAGFSLFAAPLAKRLGIRHVISGEGERALASLLRTRRLPMSGDDVQVVSEPYASFATRALRHPLGLVRAYLRSTYAEIGVETRRRKCMKKCSYCPYAFLQKDALGELRDLARLEEEVTGLYAAGVRSIFFTDAVFNADLPFAKRVCAMLASLDLRGMRWSAYFVPSSFDDELAELLGSSGNRNIVFSPDSFDDGMMKATGKLFTMAHVRRARLLCERHGLTAKWLLLFGAPWETRASIAKTARFANRHLETSEVDVHVGIRILPGTRIASSLGLTAEELLEPVFYPIRPEVFDWIFEEFDSRFFEGFGLFRHLAQRAARRAMRAVPAPRRIEADLDYLLLRPAS